MPKYAVLILWRKKDVPANSYAFCISAGPIHAQANLQSLAENKSKVAFYECLPQQNPPAQL